MIGLEYILNIENMTKSEFADKIGISASMVFRWVKGKRPISQKRIIQIHRELFPLYPMEYYSKKINNYDMAILQNIKQTNFISGARNLYELTQLALFKELGIGAHFNDLTIEKSNSFDSEVYIQLRETFKGIISRYKKRDEIHKVLVMKLNAKNNPQLKEQIL